MSLMSKAARVARTRQGRDLVERAQKLARDPETKRKIADARARLASRGRGA